jgi:hypothetical protein
MIGSGFAFSTAPAPAAPRAAWPSFVLFWLFAFEAWFKGPLELVRRWHFGEIIDRTLAFDDDFVRCRLLNASIGSYLLPLVARGDLFNLGALISG